MAKQIEEKKIGYWAFEAPNKIVSTKEDKPFDFELVRYKDDDTHEETLEIKSLLKDDNNGSITTDNGSITTDICRLGNDIKELMKFGVVLSPLDFTDLQKIIESSYLKLKITKVTVGDDDRLTALIDLVRDYVRDDGDLITEDFCYIRANDFNDLALDCGYSSFELKALRTALVKGKYIYTQERRFAILKRIKGKPERVLAFYRKKLGVDVPTKKEKKTSSGDKE